jgi:hypothetical protein
MMATKKAVSPKTTPPKKTDNATARAATEVYASPFSTAFGGTAPSTELDAARQYASPFSTAFGGTAPTTELEATRQYASPFSTAFGGTAPTMSSEVPAGSTGGTGGGGTKSVTDVTDNADGSVTITYSDGSKVNRGGPNSLPKTKNKSAFDLITLELKNNGLESLIVPLTKLFEDGIEDGDSLRLALAGTTQYQDRFKANEARKLAGLRALSPAEYIRLEDQYQEIMRNYGLPASYYTKDATGKQVGFEKFIAGDVSAVELEDRIATAQNRVLKANPEVSTALKQFYPDITNGDILAYTLDPSKGLEDIKRKVTAAEIGGAALQAGLTTGMTRAEELRNAGIDKAEATAGYSTIGAGLQRGSELASIYGEDPYTQTTAESEIFKLSGQQEARKQRQKVTGLEKATFGGQSGLTAGALARDRAGGI